MTGSVFADPRRGALPPTLPALEKSERFADTKAGSRRSRQAVGWPSTADDPWPDLPEAEEETRSRRLDDFQMRALDRRRRLAAEQRGMPWSG